MFKFIKKLFDNTAYLKMTRESANKTINQEIAMHIGYFFLSKIEGSCLFDEIAEASKHIKNMGIHKIEYESKKNVINITLEKPGLLIGERGKTIDDLTKCLAKQLNNNSIKIHLIEDTIISYLYSFYAMLGDY